MRTVLVILCFSSALRLSALCPDTLCATFSSDLSSCNSGSITPIKKNITSTQAYNITYIGVPLILGGFVAIREDDPLRRLRNDYIPRFNIHIDDYLQYSPAIVMLGMKSAGVQGRSSWGRMMVSDAFSACIMGGIVNTLKTTTHVTRPDGSNTHSFPSGHTAMAFMSATMLAKEYGHRSPLISMGAYTAASATGLMRMANNRHWLSDVLTGAGIGIISTELGYLLADNIFKDKGLHPTDAPENFAKSDKPSFVSLYLGANIPLSHYDIDEKNTFSTSCGSSVGVEGAYFLSPHIGIGGRITISNTFIITNNNEAENNTFDAISLCGGGYFSYPVTSKWLIGSKLLGGYVHYHALKLSDNTISARKGICFGSGISLTYRAKEHYGIRFFLDHNLLPSHCPGSREWMNTLTCGISLALTF